MTVYGYVRVSTADQNPLLQIEARKESGIADDALGVWQEHHNSTRTTDRPRAGGISRELRQKTSDGTVTHADLARIFAAGSMKYERDEPGPLAEMSEHHAQLAVSPPAYGYMARQLERAMSKDAMGSWNALLIQAARLSLVMAETGFGGSRPQLGAANKVIATVVITTAQERLDEQADQVATRPANKTEQVETQSVQEPERPDYMSPSEFADLTSALQKRPRISPDVGQIPTASNNAQEPDHAGSDREHGATTNSEGVTR